MTHPAGIQTAGGHKSQCNAYKITMSTQCLARVLKAYTKASSRQAAELLSRLLAKLKTQRNTAGQISPHWAHSSAFRTQGSHRCWWPNLYESVCLDLNATLPPALAHVIIAPSTYQRRTEHSKMGCNPAVAMFYGKHCMPSSHNTSTVHNAVRRTKLLLSST